MEVLLYLSRILSLERPFQTKEGPSTRPNLDFEADFDELDKNDSQENKTSEFMDKPSLNSKTNSAVGVKVTELETAVSTSNNIFEIALNVT